MSLDVSNKQIAQRKLVHSAECPVDGRPPCRCIARVVTPTAKRCPTSVRPHHPLCAVFTTTAVSLTIDELPCLIRRHSVTPSRPPRYTWLIAPPSRGPSHLRRTPPLGGRPPPHRAQPLRELPSPPSRPAGVCPCPCIRRRHPNRLMPKGQCLAVADRLIVCPILVVTRATNSVITFGFSSRDVDADNIAAVTGRQEISATRGIKPSALHASGVATATSMISARRRACSSDSQVPPDDRQTCSGSLAAGTLDTFLSDRRDVAA